MKNFKVKVILAPSDCQVKMLFDTFDMYNELCNFISIEMFGDFFYKKQHGRFPRFVVPNSKIIDPNFKNAYEDVRNKFPNIDVHFIPLAFRRVRKAYQVNIPDKAYKFTGTLDFSNLIVSVKFSCPPPDNIGMLTIKMMAGYQDMWFIFDNTQRKYLRVAFDRSRFRPYQVVYQDDLFCLITDVCSHNKINSLVDNPSITKTTINDIITREKFNNNYSHLQVTV